jgi:hypothetical protein
VPDALRRDGFGRPRAVSPLRVRLESWSRRPPRRAPLPLAASALRAFRLRSLQSVRALQCCRVAQCWRSPLAEQLASAPSTRCPGPPSGLPTRSPSCERAWPHEHPRRPVAHAARRESRTFTRTIFALYPCSGVPLGTRDRAVLVANAGADASDWHGLSLGSSTYTVEPPSSTPLPPPLPNPLDSLSPAAIQARAGRLLEFVNPPLPVTGRLCLVQRLCKLATILD